MAALVTVRFLGRPSDPALVVPPRAAWRLIRPHRDGSYICYVRENGGSVDLLDAASRLPADITEVWLLPKDCRPARSPLASAA